MVHTFLGGDQADYVDYKKNKKITTLSYSKSNSTDQQIGIQIQILNSDLFQ